MRGLIAGDAIAEPVALALPRFLLLLLPLDSDLLSFSRLPGVLAPIGDATEGLSSADGGRVDDGVLSGPSLGVLRAEKRGVCSGDSTVSILSLIHI